MRISRFLSSGFTFLETLVVISIFSLVFPLVLSILFVILQQQLRITSLTEVKRQGDYIINYLQTAIADNGYTVYDSSATEICEVGGLSPYPHSGVPAFFRDKYGSDFILNYSWPDLTISYPPVPVPAPTFSFAQGSLNNSKVIIDAFDVTCSRASPFSAPLVSINFTICYNLNGSCSSSEPQRAVSLDYQSNIKLRSYPTQ